MWIDFVLFILLFTLFAYIFATVTITNLHKAYLVFHFSMMVWPFCQFAIKATDNPQLQLLYVKIAFVDMSMLTVGWLLFTLFLTGRSPFPRRKVLFTMSVPTICAAIIVILNPYGMFVEPLDGGYIQRTYGPLFWLCITIFIGYVFVSLYMMYLALAGNSSPRIKKQVKQVLTGIVVMTIFILADIALNVVFWQSLKVLPGLTSLGIMLSAIIFVVAIHRDKVFDIVTIAHQDIINTIAHGIVVLDDNETIVEINHSLRPYFELHVGDRFDITSILPHHESTDKTNAFIQTYQQSPLKRAEIEVMFNRDNRRYIHIHAAPIIVRDAMVGRIITFQDMSVLRRLINETNLQNQILHDRNQSLIAIQRELFESNQKLEKMAITDSLTNCYNRHYLTQQLELEVIKNMNHRIPFSLLLVDIDYFKFINDNYGHLAGDRVLCSTVEVIRQNLRQRDILARYGGEEFIIYLPNTTRAQANILAERIKSTVEANKMNISPVTPALSITISVGLLALDNMTLEPVKDSKSTLNELFQSVDEALYQAKREGRNRIVSIAK
ncbi:histidine kinase N-terminal 7TM domain-containing diguanylate cyclase [Paenibacillus guangzhouensis]|uniref:histidine kinase N-terminal 7TM domain-containing diguanylate cyclase n=1 Tax=Paenibacillus guangzhouensis TaxID=1473112 RepID=UPI00126721C4|nr:diguanylate cyclase [Paenibacillus guangzhouensis]